MQRRSVRVAVALIATAAVSVGGCAIEELDAQESEATQATIVVRPCGGEQCGENSPVVDVFKFHDANLRGIQNSIGMSIDTVGGIGQIVKAGTSYNLVVQDAKIKGVLGATTISGTQLIGADIPISQGKSHFKIHIRDAREMSYFVGGGPTVGAYRFELISGEGFVTELCNNRKLLEKMIGEQGGFETDYARWELMGMRVWETVVFEGDRVKADPKTMSNDFQIEDTWFNFGCAGHTLAKLLLTHNTYHSQSAPGPAPAQAWERRQATMKMLAADYCGDGVPFTVAGQKLAWRGDLVSFYTSTTELEARWYEKGALCLDVPRLMHPSSALGATTYPNVRASIAATCVFPGRPPPPPCRNKDPNQDDGGYRVTGNPP